MPITDFIARKWRGLWRPRHARHADRDTLNAVADLPPHILKDIGWLSAYERQRHRDGF